MESVIFGELRANAELQQLLNSSENEPWADQFDGLTPATPAFNAVWKQIAQDEPIAFAQAQDDFMWETKYTKYVDTVKAAT